MKKNISLLIKTVVVASTCAVVILQLLLSIKNYEEKKNLIKIDVKNVLDEAIEMYYLHDAKGEFITVIDNNLSRPFKDFSEAIQYDSISHKPISVNFVKNHKTKSLPISSYQVILGKLQADSISQTKNKGNTIFFPFKQDTVNLKLIAKRFEKGLARKNIDLQYDLHFTSQKFDSKSSLTNNNTMIDTIHGVSSYLPEKSTLYLYYSTPEKSIWKKSIFEILLSFFLSSIVISCLFYLFSIIRIQEQNNQVRNDFVSNIAHEFNTPIATASSALEAVIKYSSERNTERNRRYIMIAQENLARINMLTNKILDTAAIDNGILTLHLKEINVFSLIEKSLINFDFHSFNKTINLSGDSSATSDLDSFYFENAINNIVDNAMKYGGFIIDIKVYVDSDNLYIEIEDNGYGIDKKQAAFVFEKFYRISNFNTHNIKGFGIGLYHSKKIIESHGGTLSLTSHYPTRFLICLPHE